MKLIFFPFVLFGFLEMKFEILVLNSMISLLVKHQIQFNTILDSTRQVDT